MTRKYPAINLLHLLNTWDADKWNQFLTKAVNSNDIPSLAKVLYGLQAGMDDLVKEKLASDKMQLLFLRWTISVERAIKQIMKKQHPNPCDNPATAKDHPEALEAKRIRDQEIVQFLKSIRY